MPQYGRTVIVLAEVRDAKALQEWIAHRNGTLRTVAEAATRIGDRERKPGEQPVKVLHSTIGHLVKRNQKSISPRRAELIEKALDVPKGSLFVYRLANVSHDDRRMA